MLLSSKKVDEKRLNISIQRGRMDPFCGPIITQIFPKMHRLAYKIPKKNFQCNTPEPLLREEATPSHTQPQRPPNVEHKSAPVV